jgi:ABC-type glycerol-3-phosphate transport system substrate-binding protein
MDTNNNSKGYSRRNFLRIAGAGATLATLGACGDAATATPTAKVAATTASSGATGQTTTAASTVISAPAVIKSEGETLKIALYGSRESAATRAAIVDPFVKKFPGAKVEYIPIQAIDWSDFFTKVLAMKAAGNTPDLTIVATEGTQIFAGKGLAVPLDDYVKRDKAELASYFKDVHPSLVEAMMYEGSLYELPSEFNAANMFINTKVLGEAGFSDISSDWTRDQFYEIAKKVTKKDASGQPQVFGYQWINRLWGGWLPWMFVNGGNLMTEERAPGGQWLWETFYKDDPAAKNRGGGWRWLQPKANDPANLEALNFVHQLTKEGIAPVPELGGGDTLQGFFASNKVAMTIAGGFWAGGLKNAGMANTAFDVRMFPKWKSQRHQFGAVGYVLMKDAKNKDLAWEFLKHAVSIESAQIYLKGNISTPARRSLLNAERYSVTGPKNWQVFYDTMEKNPDTAPIPAPAEANQMTTIFTKYTGLAMASEMPTKAALDAMQKDLEAVFAKK